MTVRYLNSGRPVRTNHILNPDFELDASNWRPMNAASTIDVVTGHQFHGGKALRITGTGTGGQHGVTYDGPHILLSDVLAPDGGDVSNVWLTANVSTDTASTLAYVGFLVEDAAGAIQTGGTKYGGAVTSTSKRIALAPSDYSFGLQSTAYIRPQIRFDHTGAGVYYVDAVQLIAGYTDFYDGTGWPSFISGNRTDGTDGLDYAWTGTPHASTSTATATRWVDMPTTGAVQEDYTITGGGFLPNETVKVTITPATLSSTQLFTTANSDGTFSYTFTMPKKAGGTTQVSVGIGNYSSPQATETVTVPLPDPPAVPEPAEGKVVNYFPDPRLKLTDGVTILGKNYHPNPSPTDSLTCYATAGTAAIVLDPTSAIKGTGGVKVTSPNSTSGIQVQFPNREYSADSNLTVYVRAREAMTITATPGAAYTFYPPTAFGWGDFGWGEPYTYTQGYTHTFAAGEVKRFRVYTRIKRVQDGGTYPDYGLETEPSPGWFIDLKGTGSFDVDGAWHGTGVDDGVDDEYFPGGVYQIADAPPFFCGDTPDTDDYTYEWAGTPRASTSIKKGRQSRYVRASGNGMVAGMEPNYAITLPGGETAVAVQSAWGESSYGTTWFTGTPGPVDDWVENLQNIGLDPAKNYAISFDFISVMDNFLEGYPGTAPWESLYMQAGDFYVGSNMPHPMRHRFILPFSAGEWVGADVSTYRNWDTGYHAVTNVSLTEIDFFMPKYTDAEAGVPGTIDLFDAGAMAGRDYVVSVDESLTDPADYYRVEYQTTAGGSTWFTASEVLHDPDNPEWTARQWSFTIPEDATACQFVWLLASGYPYINVFAAPVPFFDGDTPDGEGYIYSWFGTPGESASIRVEGTVTAPSLTAKVFVGGIAKTITEIRAVKEGILVPVTETGA